MTVIKTNKIAFLLGCGTSISVGMPKTQEITERILSGKDIMRHTDGNYYFGKATNGFKNEYIEKSVIFLKRI